MKPFKKTSASKSLTKNIHLLELIRSKRERHWKPALEEARLGFRGWHQRGYLPHFDAPNVTQMITFMLADSIPVRRHPEWEALLKEDCNSPDRRKIEEWLDQGYGHCWMRNEKIAQCVENCLIAGDGHDYRLQAWVMMPNHVHVVVNVWQIPLAKLIQRWKGRSARESNILMNQRGPFWQEDYFDTLVRNEAHLAKSIRYVEQNPVKARLVKSSRDWRWSSARCRDEYERLPWQRNA